MQSTPRILYKSEDSRLDAEKSAGQASSQVSEPIVSDSVGSVKLTFGASKDDCSAKLCPIRLGLLRRDLNRVVVADEEAFSGCDLLYSCSTCALELLDADDRLQASRRWGS
jgi:hypothetical protein